MLPKFPVLRHGLIYQPVDHSVIKTNKIKSFVIGGSEPTNEERRKQSEQHGRNSLTEIPDTATEPYRVNYTPWIVYIPMPWMSTKYG